MWGTLRSANLSRKIAKNHLTTIVNYSLRKLNLMWNRLIVPQSHGWCNQAQKRVLPFSRYDIISTITHSSLLYKIALHCLVAYTPHITRPKFRGTLCALHRAIPRVNGYRALHNDMIGMNPCSNPYPTLHIATTESNEPIPGHLWY